MLVRLRLRLRLRVLDADEALHAAQVEQTKRAEGGRAPWYGLGLGVRARARVRGSRRSRRRPCGYVTKSCAV